MTQIDLRTRNAYEDEGGNGKGGIKNQLCAVWIDILALKTRKIENQLNELIFTVTVVPKPFNSNFHIACAYQ